MTNQKCVDTIATTDRHGHMICKPGAVVFDRYRIVKELGKGSFSRVVHAIDTKTDSAVALKISRDKTVCRKAAKREIMTLRYIARRDPNGTSFCAKMIDSFSYNGHICITFDILGCDIYHFLEKNEFTPFSLDQVRHIAYQLCHSVNFLHRRGIIHTDIKTDNILFVDSTYTKEYNAETKMNIRTVNRTDIRLIDFGCAANDEFPLSATISNRNYRAPEVLLNANWSHGVDVWSIGCVLYELYTGYVVFNTDDNDHEHLAIMEKVLGPFPMTMVGQHKYFTNSKVNFNWNEKPLEVHCHQPLRKSMKAQTDDDLHLFDLMEKMLTFEPNKRIMLQDALRHEFFEKLSPAQRCMI